MYAASLPRFGRSKNGVAARAASTICLFVDCRNCVGMGNVVDDWHCTYIVGR